MKAPSLRRGAGVTLIELLVVLAIGIILLGTAIPAFHSALQRLRLQAAANDLLAAIDLARSQAIAHGGKVVMAPLGAGWQSGWAVFVDHNNNRRHDAGEPLFYRHDPLPDTIRIASNFSSSAASLYVAYNGAGRACSADNTLAARWGTLSLTQGGQARNIKINMLGRVRVCDPAREQGNCGGAVD
ncbi:type IV fimbrial biogenesis protein FimT [Duganella sacchari]|uniref:Type II secretion system protein H n=1 Tax=Duganella sacchari TaxID=551987 RepID=A0A1M7QGD8_9BURK|nr:GspH/FimT family pseudopilin [Duganella sacchari]SHN30008.1 type IV fimbrial biogenesis protein FimT [Duganella sacchari]